MLVCYTDAKHIRSGAFEGDLIFMLLELLIVLAVAGCRFFVEFMHFAIADCAYKLSPQELNRSSPTRSALRNCDRGLGFQTRISKIAIANQSVHNWKTESRILMYIYSDSEWF